MTEEPVFVKTADLHGRRSLRELATGGAQWAFCRDCYGNEMRDGLTRDAEGNVCATCDGSGALWRVAPSTQPKISPGKPVGT